MSACPKILDEVRELVRLPRTAEARPGVLALVRSILITMIRDGAVTPGELLASRIITIVDRNLGEKRPGRGHVSFGVESESPTPEQLENYFARNTAESLAGRLAAPSGEHLLVFGIEAVTPAGASSDSNNPLMLEASSTVAVMLTAARLADLLS